MNVTSKLQGTVKLPTPKLLDYPLNVTLNIYPVKDKYGMDIWVKDMGAPRRVNIPMTADEVESSNRQLQQELRQLTVRSDVTLNASKYEIERKQRSLAELGNFVYKRIFRDPDALDAIEHLATFQGPIYIDIISDSFFLPWEALYPKSLDDRPIDSLAFWGMNYVISRVLHNEKGRLNPFVPPTIYLEQPPNLALLTYDKLSNVVKREIPFFEELKQNRKILLEKMTDLNPDLSRADELGKLKRFCAKPFDIVHMACHAYHNSEAPNKSAFKLTREFYVSLQDFEIYEIDINNNPIVVLNACRTGVANPLYSWNFAQYLIQRGARGVIAAECPIPDDFAVEFSGLFYESLLDGEPAGKCLLRVRKHLCVESNNVSGLAYSLYGSPNIQLIYDEEQ